MTLLRSDPLEGGSLNAAIAHLTQSFDRANGLHLIVQINAQTTLPARIQIAAYRITEPNPSSQSDSLASLTRKREGLSLIATGANNREIDEILCITEKTVKNHITNILSRLSLRDRTQAAVFAYSAASLESKIS